MKITKIFVVMFGLLYISNTTIYAQYENLDVLFAIMDPNFPESGLNDDRVGKIVCHIGDINGDGFDDWAIGLPGVVNYETGLNTGTVHIYFGGEIPDSESPADLILGCEKGKSLFGINISAAGDVNNDGYDDLLVRYINKDASGEDNTPSVALFYGGAPFDTQADIAFTAVDGHADYWFGTLSDAGDVNNDGYDDIIIGAPTSIGELDSGHVYLYYGGQYMDNIADLIFTGHVSPPAIQGGGAANFGSSITGAGDMNNDGFDDIIINASNGGKLYLGGSDMNNIEDVLFNDLTGYGTGPIVSGVGDVNNDGYDDIVLGAKVAGQAYICYGGETIDSTSDVILPGWADWDYFGRSLSGGGDLNSDGFDDVIVGSDYDGVGETRVYLGASPMNNTPDIIMYGEVSGDRFGYTVSGGGDLNGDGYSDIIVGGVGNYNTIGGEDDQGNISLFYGGESMDSVAEAVFTGVSSNSYFGNRASNAGDVNNDGFPDVIVGQGSYYTNGRWVGRAYMYFGSSSPDNTPDIVFMSEDLLAHYNFGGLVRGVGDVNNDGYSDVIIAETNSRVHNRKVYLHLGSESMDSIPDLSFRVDIAPYRPQAFSAVGDVNNDGFDDILLTLDNANLYLGGETMDNIADITFDSTNYSGSGAGDLNGDGFRDFMINSYRDDGSPVVKVIFGNTTISNTPQLILGKELNESSFGYGIAGGHDINNDGYDDIVVSAYLYDATPSGEEGRVYIYYGGESMDEIPDVIITGETVGLKLGCKVMTIPDLNADGYDEVLISHGYHIDDFPEIAMYIYYGGAPMDSVPDIVLPHNWERDVTVYSHPTEDYVGLVVGEPNISAVIVYTNSNLSGSSQNKEIISLPDDLTLHQNFPNPFNSITVIGYQLSAVSDVDLSIYNMLGQKVATLVFEKQPAGQYQVRWNANGFPGGIYFYQFKTKNHTKIKKMLLVK